MGLKGSPSKAPWRIWDEDSNIWAESCSRGLVNQLKTLAPPPCLLSRGVKWGPQRASAFVCFAHRWQLETFQHNNLVATNPSLFKSRCSWLGGGKVCVCVCVIYTGMCIYLLVLWPLLTVHIDPGRLSAVSQVDCFLWPAVQTQTDLLNLSMNMNTISSSLNTWKNGVNIFFSFDIWVRKCCF